MTPAEGHAVAMRDGQIVAEAGEIAMLDRVAASVSAVDVAILPPKAALITDVPAFTPVMRPPAVAPTAALLAEVNCHWVVTSTVLPSE